MKPSIALLTLALTLAGRMMAQPGALDPTFGEGGTELIALSGVEELEAEGILVQDDGRIVVAGTARVDGVDHFALLRFLPDGSPDTDFGDEGAIVSHPTPWDDRATMAAFQADGKIVIAGTSVENFDGTGSISIVRYDAQGQLDAEFGTDGLVRFFGPEGWALQAEHVLVNAFGKILVAGRAVSQEGDTQGLLALFTPDGDPSHQFGDGDGYALYGLGHIGNGYFRESISAVAETENGEFIAVGGCEVPGSPGTKAFRMKVESDGDVADFGGNYFSWNSGPNWANAVALGADGHAVIGGYGHEGGQQMGYMRCGDDGSVDQDGMLTFLDPSHSSVAHAVATTASGWIYLAGSATGSTGRGFALARLDGECGEDGGFGANGYVLTAMGADGQAEAKGVAVQPDGRVVMAGYAFSNGHKRLALGRYLSDTHTGIVAEVASLRPLQVYPNPATDRVTVEYELSAGERISLELVDALGHVVDRPAVESLRPAGSQRETYTLPTLTAGAYVLRLTDAQGTRVARVIIN